jgi:hypothetical protein
LDLEEGTENDGERAAGARLIVDDEHRGLSCFHFGYCAHERLLLYV